ncbi:uncharacterized protein OCT59_003617 [Rhizophagus irregularis]|nr:hypothetical protein OCT59_003617 [Rhizophagus irregularis]
MVTKGIKWVREAAIEGLADAQLDLGEAYYLQGMSMKEKKWWLKSAMQNAAADNDVKMAQKELALMYRIGNCGLKKEVVELYNAAAKDTKHYAYIEKGNCCSQYNLGECCELGLLKVNKNPKKALKWYKEAAKQGDILALMRLGIIQENNLTLTNIQKKLKGIHTLPTSEELEEVDILIYLYVYSPSTIFCSFKKITDELND